MEQIVLCAPKQSAHVVQQSRRIRKEARVVQRCHMPHSGKHRSAPFARAAIHDRLEPEYFLYFRELSRSDD